jgi:hypothetical protein
MNRIYGNVESLSVKFDDNFEHSWRAEIMKARPLILPRRHFTYPSIADEVERGALEVMLTPAKSEAFLATCALGFRDPAVPSGIWSTPNLDWVCAVSGGYAYMINAENPAEFTMIEMRPVLAVHIAIEARLLIFVGNRKLIAWGREGLVWESENLSDEGMQVDGIENELLRGRGWDMRTDRDYRFDLDLKTGKMSRK